MRERNRDYNLVGGTRIRVVVEMTPPSFEVARSAAEVEAEHAQMDIEVAEIFREELRAFLDSESPSPGEIKEWVRRVSPLTE